MTHGTPRAWRSREELREVEAGRLDAGRAPEAQRPEFPPGADLPPDGLTRRSMLGLMGASVALGGLTACRRPVEEIVPYVQAPEGFTPGIPRHYATTLPIGAHAYGVLVESHEGRPTKVEGNPRHPASQGAATAWMQAAILDLYDPDRLRGATRRTPETGAPTETSWGDFAAWWQESSPTLAADGGERLAVLAGAHCSPTLARLARQLRATFPAARWVVHEPAGDEAVYEGLRRATGAATRPLADLSRARTVVALDADLFLTESEPIRHARGFAARRRAEGAPPPRLYAVESTLSVTGGTADHRLRLPSRQIGAFAAALAEELGVGTGDVSAAGLPAPARARARVIARDLAASRGEAVVLAGRRQPPQVHALVHRVNQALGAVGTVLQVDSLPEGAAGAWDGADLADLARAIRGGEIDTLVVLGGNPAFTAPAELELPKLLAEVPHVVALVSEANETAKHAEWTLPLAHPFESWGDAVAAGGTRSVIQPLIEPLFGGRSAIELVGLLATGEERPGYELVRETWQPLTGGDETAWRRVLHDGAYAPGGATGASEDVSADTPVALTAAPPAQTPTGPASAEPPAGGWVAAAPAGPVDEPAAPPPTAEPPVEDVSAETPPGAEAGRATSPATPAIPPGGLELVFTVSPAAFDGRYGNNAWLQEMPDPVSKVCWTNAASVSPATARELGVEDGDVVRLAAGGREIELPVVVQPGQADGSVAVALGYGRTAAGRVAQGLGANAYALRTAAAPWIAGGVELARTGRRTELARTQEHWWMEGRDLVRTVAAGANGHAAAPATANGHAAAPADGHGQQAGEDAGEGHGAIRLWDPPPLGGKHQWGMAIDLAACTGCNACVVACQSENNIPVVGPEQVRRGREMHWLRVDRYFVGTEDDPDTAFQPVPCMHCENAPCEQVCPVAATVHDAEGINAMVYNRCIGTRYCSNNCPYKVRRFNYFNFTRDTPTLVMLAMNPDVTVRSRGVMEKCTYCIQRINAGKAEARRADRPLADGEIQTACQQTCPADAITFGDLLDEGSEVNAWKASPRNYVLLEELNNFPRTSYLARTRNPNPEWERA